MADAPKNPLEQFASMNEDEKREMVLASLMAISKGILATDHLMLTIKEVGDRLNEDDNLHHDIIAVIGLLSVEVAEVSHAMYAIILGLAQDRFSILDLVAGWIDPDDHSRHPRNESGQPTADEVTEWLKRQQRGQQN